MNQYISLKEMISNHPYIGIGLLLSLIVIAYIGAWIGQRNFDRENKTDDL